VAAQTRDPRTLRIMTRLLSLLTVALLLIGTSACRATGASQPFYVHDVYFTLTDSSPQAAATLVDACHEYLGDLPGIVKFAAGTRDESADRDVNDLEFDVSLHVWFDSPAAYASYGTAPKHLEFIEVFSGNWAGVRVFDSNASGR